MRKYGVGNGERGKARGRWEVSEIQVDETGDCDKPMNRFFGKWFESD
jgi:hypothetical protein